MNNEVAVSYAGNIPVTPGYAPLALYPFQQEAIQKLNKIPDSNKPEFSGLLVVPTGGGKTRIAVRWVLKNVIDRNKKVLWIAHRHELLEQAFVAIENDRSILTNRTSFRFRIISGQHGKPVDIRHDDDIIIASKDSLTRGLNYLNEWLASTDEIYLIIDEAHHATAKTYRKVINTVKGDNVEKKRVFRMLGLTATPFRTAESEQGLLGKLFKDDIVYNIDLQELISHGILSDPIFEELRTNLDFAKELTAKDIKTIQAFDKLPERIAEQIATSNERNKSIVSHYVQHQTRYSQLLVFAIDKVHAIALNELFNTELNKLFNTKGKTYSEYAVSDIRDMATGIRISSKENKEKIERFRENKTKVLVNVNILTEGTDLPNVQTVFLTRSTMSTILMTQMIGRALRGEKADGTPEAFIVSFIDDWKDKISWVNPERVRIETSAEFIDSPAKTSKQITQLIAIAKIEEFARMMHELVPELEALDFLQRIPVGIYSFSILLTPPEDKDTLKEIKEDLYSLEQGDALEKNCEVLVFSDIQQAYRNFIDDLEILFQEVGLVENDDLTDEELDDLRQTVVAEYFDGYDNKLPGYQDEDIKDILRYYAQKGIAPTFLEFKDREKCGLAKEARYIYENSLGGKEQTAYIDSLWNDENSFWHLLFWHREDYFRRQLSIELEKIAWPPYPPPPPGEIIPDSVDSAGLPLSEMMEEHRDYWRKLRHEAFAQHTDAEGFITCPGCGYRAKRKRFFQIDHIVPMSKGGLSKIDNLQILCRTCNGSKGDQTIDFRNNRTRLTIRPATFREFQFPREEKADDDNEWEKYLRRSINFFYQCAAVESIVRSSDQSFNHWQINLHKGNDPAWFKPHLEELVNSIHDYQVAAGIRGLQGLKITSPNKPRAAYFIAHSPKSKVINNSTPPSSQPAYQTSTYGTSKRKALALIPDGTVCRFLYKRKEFEGIITNGEIIIRQKGRFTSFSTASKTITGTPRNGWLDWQLQLPGTEDWILADDWWKKHGKR